MRRLLLLALVALFATACGGADDEASVSPEQAHNEQDVAFVEHMIPHHRQALEMTALAREQASDARVENLAERISVAQLPEIVKMEGWISEWGVTTTTVDPAHAGHSAMEGMMTPDQMKELKSATGLAFDRRFLEMMIEHHMGAITMAEEETRKGKDPEVVALANEIRGSQSTEVDEMQAILATL